MECCYIFADEAGCLTFKNINGASKYFILCTVTMHNCMVGNALLDLRRKLVLNGDSQHLKDFFHATDDAQYVRNRVFEVLQAHNFSVQATIMEKRKAQHHIRETATTFYKYGWYYHFKHGMLKNIAKTENLLISAASIGSRKEKLSFSKAIHDVILQTTSHNCKIDFRACKADPCLQVADYCAWAIQRKWEREDKRSYDLIQNKITYEYELWQHGNTIYY